MDKDARPSHEPETSSVAQIIAEWARRESSRIQFVASYSTEPAAVKPGKPSLGQIGTSSGSGLCSLDCSQQKKRTTQIAANTRLGDTHLILDFVTNGVVTDCSSQEILLETAARVATVWNIPSIAAAITEMEELSAKCRRGEGVVLIMPAGLNSLRRKYAELQDQLHDGQVDYEGLVTEWKSQCVSQELQKTRTKMFAAYASPDLVEPFLELLRSGVVTNREAQWIIVNAICEHAGPEHVPPILRTLVSEVGVGDEVQLSILDSHVQHYLSKVVDENADVTHLGQLEEAVPQLQGWTYVKKTFQEDAFLLLGSKLNDLREAASNLAREPTLQAGARPPCMGIPVPSQSLGRRQF
ncbi:hypothetical protein COX84_03520 [Candidatus Micrarchaeota archaeon CG_4_10_14_0_2_um_filter_49_7]|nr:MAG: hypothetical protein AUJ13_00050 [Candidatus Micrarchaeota archaeon CG1_02_49_24]PIZ96959.1 MAG: hypothetical protein COX84_03520 [Candidatus Micrarchaeota archaeon CG_4_10_14_0_2_um_filter_49_7]HII54170.1 hypothetical protein [Candidatus Micrarchaeota archaeon]